MMRGALIRHQLRDRAICGNIKMRGEGGATGGKVGQGFKRGPKVAMKHDQINAAAAPRRASGWWRGTLLNVVFGHGASFCYRGINSLTYRSVMDCSRFMIELLFVWSVAPFVAS